MLNNELNQQTDPGDDGAIKDTDPDDDGEGRLNSERTDPDNDVTFDSEPQENGEERVLRIEHGEVGDEDEEQQEGD